ncbi:hypothetical protein CKAN_01323100 [Cinnamomum micranthum f. kanehirae]|uniref:Wound-responsive family protein n=1 Tax=Cinnamomum micranthum f. kanehirae TaxID=337451 RepID=A0A443P0Z2_9MAGN|nr:hypothetical protein CKAN_01323100 [Cinnamomum micranthum f. kanehirae]
MGRLFSSGRYLLAKSSNRPQVTRQIRYPPQDLVKAESCKVKKMSSTSRAWIVAASVGAVEALKDQGVCRWNYVLRSLHQQAKKNMGSSLQAMRVSTPLDSLSSSSSSKQSEESLRKVMFLSCWGPN